MARFTQRQPTTREARRSVVVVLEQTTVPASDTATGLDRVERILISELKGSKTVTAELIDWAGRVYETRHFATVDEAKATYTD